MTSDSTDITPKKTARRRRWPWFVLAVFAALLLIVRIAMQSDSVLERIRLVAEDQAGSLLNAELRIGSLEGDLWNHLVIGDLKLVLPDQEPQQILAIERMEMAYSLPRLLIRRPFHVDQLLIDNVRGDIRQDSKGRWNVFDMLPDPPVDPPEPSDPVPFEVGELIVRASEIRVQADQWMADTPLFLRDAVLQSRVGMDERGFYVDLNELAFFVHEERLEQPISFDTRLAWDGRRVTLDKLVVAGARTLFDASGTFDSVSSVVDAVASLDPLAWDEVTDWVDGWPLAQDLSARLYLGGSRQQLRAGLHLAAPGVEQIHLEVGGTLSPEPALTHFLLSSGRVDAAELMGDSSLVAGISGLFMRMDGVAPLDDPQRVRMDGTMSVRAPFYEAFRLDSVSVDMQASRGELELLTRLYQQNEHILLALDADRWFTDEVVWKFDADIVGMNPAVWAETLFPEGYIQGQLAFEGTGLNLLSDAWGGSVALSHVQWDVYPQANILFGVEVENALAALELQAGVDEALLQADGTIDFASEQVSYGFDARFSGLNTAVMPGLEPLVTDLQGTLALSGQGFDLETLQATGTLDLGGSEVNRQRFEVVQADLELDGGWLGVPKARVTGPPFDLFVSLRQNLFDLVDSRNRLDFSMELLDLQGFANLAGLDTLQIFGRLTGSVRAHAAGGLSVETLLALEQLRFDALTVSDIEGSARALVSEDIAYNADLVIRGPGVGDVIIRDISLATQGLVSDGVTIGDYDFAFIFEDESGFNTQAGYRIDDQIELHTTALELREPGRTYYLHAPVRLSYDNGVVQMDTLRLEASDQVWLSMSVNKPEAAPWQAYFSARGIDLGQVQYIFLEQPLLEAVFTGELNMLYDEQELMLQSEASVTGLVFEEIAVDSLQLSLNILDKRLQTMTKAWHKGADLIYSRFDIPFDLAGLTADELEMFAEPVNGFFTIHPVDLDTFRPFLDAMNLKGLKGTFSLHSTLGGVAGEPEFTGGMRVESGALSGIPLDSLWAAWDYEHERSDLVLRSGMYARGQKAADVQATVPLHLDFRQLTAEGPGQDDAVTLHATTNDFDLAVANEFLDESVLRRLQGRLNADVRIGGTFSAPAPEGSVRLAGGQVYLVENNVTLRNMRMDVRLEPGRVVLQELTAQSVGSFRGSGAVALEGLVPADMKLNFEATNFRVFNTRDMEIFAGLDLNMGGTLEDPVLTGDIFWERGVLYLDDFGERQVEQVILEEEEQADTVPDLFDRLRMELRFVVDRNAWLRNRRDPEMNLALRGELDLVKDPFEELQVFGDMGVSSGHVTTFGKRFQLEQGDILFSGEMMNPAMQIVTLFQPRQQYEDIRIYYIISGTLEDPEFSYESDPEMDFKDIVSYTLFGRPFYALAAWEQTVSDRSYGDMAGDVALDILLDQIEQLASDRLGIDVIEIENTRKGGGSGTSIKAGKFVSDRMFVAFLQELGGTEAGRQVVVEYMLRRNLNLIITASDDFRTGLDMLWRFDY